VRDDGTLSPGPSQTLVASSGEPVAWSVAAAPDGTVYLGTGYSARLLKIKNGVSSVLYEGPEVAISALALDTEGNLYAGVSPGGRVYRFTPDGTRTTVLQSDETFVHALKIQGGDLLVGTGGERARLYRVPLRGEVELGRKPLATLPMKHVRSLSVRGDEVFAGGAGEAVLARIDRDGTVAALFQATGTASNSAASSSQNSSGPTVVVIQSSGAPTSAGASTLSSPGGGSFGSSRGGNEISAVAATTDGVYFGTLSSGAVSRWTAERGVQPVWSGPGRSIYALEATATGEVLAATDGGEVWRLTPDGTETRAARVLDATQPQVLSLTTRGQRVFAATANNAAVYEIGAGTEGASYVSNVFDAGQLVRWGAFRFVGEGATLETRSGNLLEPDATWSAWTPLQDGQIPSPAARYLQYRARLGEGGTVSRIEALFRAPNRAPRAAWTFPTGGDFVSGKKTLTWTATDPDGDTLRSLVELQKPDGNFSVLETKPGQNSLEWDSTKFPDGTYRVRLTASDATRNPEDPLRDVVLSLPFTLDNTAPKLENVRAEAGEGGWTLRALGSDASPLAGAEWRALAVETTPTPAPTSTNASSTSKTPAPGASPTVRPDSASTAPQWQAMASADGVFDQKSESLVARLENAPGAIRLASGQKIEVRLRDAAGNFSTTTVVLP
jgi:sugar lactone lactonase YvrE